MNSAMSLYSKKRATDTICDTEPMRSDLSARNDNEPLTANLVAIDESSGRGDMQSKNKSIKKKRKNISSRTDVNRNNLSQTHAISESVLNSLRIRLCESKELLNKMTVTLRNKYKQIWAIRSLLIDFCQYDNKMNKLVLNGYNLPTVEDILEDMVPISSLMDTGNIPSSTQSPSVASSMNSSADISILSSFERSRGACVYVSTASYHFIENSENIAISTTALVKNPTR